MTAAGGKSSWKTQESQGGRNRKVRVEETGKSGWKKKESKGGRNRKVRVEETLKVRL